MKKFLVTKYSFLIIFFSLILNASSYKIDNGDRVCINTDNAEFKSLEIKDNKLISLNSIPLKEEIDNLNVSLGGLYVDDVGSLISLSFEIKDAPELFYKLAKNNGIDVPSKYEELTLSQDDETIGIYNCFVPGDNNSFLSVNFIQTVENNALIAMYDNGNTAVIYLNTPEVFNTFREKYPGWNFTEDDIKKYKEKLERLREEKLKALITQYDNPSGIEKCNRAYEEMKSILFREGYASYAVDINLTAQVWGECQSVFPEKYKIY